MGCAWTSDQRADREGSENGGHLRVDVHRRHLTESTGRWSD
jgi:hypothetical protein